MPRGATASSVRPSTGGERRSWSRHTLHDHARPGHARADGEARCRTQRNRSARATGPPLTRSSHGVLPRATRPPTCARSCSSSVTVTLGPPASPARPGAPDPPAHADLSPPSSCGRPWTADAARRGDGDRPAEFLDPPLNNLTRQPRGARHRRDPAPADRQCFGRGHRAPPPFIQCPRDAGVSLFNTLLCLHSSSLWDVAVLDDVIPARPLSKHFKKH